MINEFRFDGEMYVCKKCGERIPRGIIGIAEHWNNCINGNKLLNTLIKTREEKGSELTIDDIDKILP